MGLIDFMKSAGAKMFGSDEPSAEEKAAMEQAAKNKRASSALENVVKKLNIPVAELEVRFNKGLAVIEGKTETTATAEKAAVAIGNIDGVSQVNNKIQVLNPEPAAVYYTVKSGDSLSKIAKSQYGDPMKYPQIFEANKPMLSHPDKIFPGQVLRIPQQ